MNKKTRALGSVTQNMNVNPERIWINHVEEHTIRTGNRLVRPFSRDALSLTELPT